MSVSLPEGLLERIRAEYLEMPSPRLTVEQLQRLSGVERTVCQQVVDSLVKAKFLCVKSDGAYTRLTDGDVSRQRAAKEELRSGRVVQARDRDQSSQRSMP
jgi:hypothetical protein